MKFVCENCHSRYHVDDAKVEGRILRIRCKRCEHIITVRQLESPQPDLTGEASPESTSAVSRGSGDASDVPLPVGEAGKVDYDHLEELQWFYSVNGRSFGPFNEDDLIAKCLSGQIGDETFVWNAGMETWRPVMEVPVFAPAIIEAISRHPQTPMLEVSDSADDTVGGVAPTVETAAGMAAESAAKISDSRATDSSPPEPLWRMLSTPATGIPQSRPKQPSGQAPPVPKAALSGGFQAAERPLGGPKPSLASSSTTDPSKDASLERLRALRERLLGSTSGKPSPRSTIPRAPTRPTPAVPSKPVATPTKEPIAPLRSVPSPLGERDEPKAPVPPATMESPPATSGPLPIVGGIESWFGPTPDRDSRRRARKEADFSLDTRDLEAVTVESGPRPVTPASLPAVGRMPTPPKPIPQIEPDEPEAPVEPTPAEVAEEPAPVEPTPAEVAEEPAPVEPTPAEVAEEVAPTVDEAPDLDEAVAEEVAPDEPTPPKLDEAVASDEAAPAEPEGREVAPTVDEAPDLEESEEPEGPTTGEIEPSKSDEDEAADEELLFDELLFFEEGELISEGSSVEALDDLDDADVAPDLKTRAKLRKRRQKAAGRAGAAELDQETDKDSAVAHFVANKRRGRVKAAMVVVAVLMLALAAVIVWTQLKEPPARDLPSAGEAESDASVATAEPVEERSTPPPIVQDVHSLNMDTTVNLARSEVGRAFVRGRDLSARASEQAADRDQESRAEEQPREERSRRDQPTERDGSDVTVAGTSEHEGSGSPGGASDGSNSIFSELGGRTVAVERQPSVVDAQAAHQQEQGHSSTLGPDYFSDDLPRVRRAVERCHGVQMRDPDGIQLERVVLDITVQPDGSVSIDMGSDLATTTFGRCLQSRYTTWNFRNFEGEPVTLTQTYALQ